MRKLPNIFLVLLLPVVLCSCPYSSPYSLDEQPGIYVEESLLGKWTALVSKKGSSQQEVMHMYLAKKTDTEYDIAFSGNMNELRRYIKSDSLKGSAFMSTVGDRQFLNIHINARVYIAELRLKNNLLSLLPLVEHFTSKMIFSSSALRNSVEIHYKTRVHPMLDEDFCLKNMVKSD